MVASRSEVMLPPAGSEARWREEVMPERASGEVMLALTHQEAKTKEKEQKTSCKFQDVSCNKGRGRRLVRAKKLVDR